jgi:hypothetical protein
MFEWEHSFGPDKTKGKPTRYFAGSYLRFNACYVDENNTVRFSEKILIDGYSKMPTLFKK